MIGTHIFTASLAFACLIAPAVCRAQTGGQSNAGTLKAGAAKVDITPPLQPMSNGWPETLRDHLYVRAIVLDNGSTRAALINADQGGLSDAIWSDASKRIAAELQCPVENILMSAIHTHSDGGPFARNVNLPGTQPAGRGAPGQGQPGGNQAQNNQGAGQGQGRGVGRGPAPNNGPNLADAIVKAVEEEKPSSSPP